MLNLSNWGRGPNMGGGGGGGGVRARPNFGRSSLGMLGERVKIGEKKKKFKTFKIVVKKTEILRN